MLNIPEKAGDDGDETEPASLQFPMSGFVTAPVVSLERGRVGVAMCHVVYFVAADFASSKPVRCGQLADILKAGYGRIPCFLIGGWVLAMPLDSCNLAVLFAIKIRPSRPGPKLFTG